MTEEKTNFIYVTYIRAAPETVFEAIIRPDIARRYWGHENISDWQSGSGWQHVRDGTRTVEIIGEVVEHTPPRRLVMTWASPPDANAPERFSRVTFDLVPYDGMVRLTVSHDQLEPGSGMATGISKGWPIVLSSLKSFLETGAAIDVFAKPNQSDLAA